MDRGQLAVAQDPSQKIDHVTGDLLYVNNIVWGANFVSRTNIVWSAAGTR
jgi:hypothetical protein